jgi:hypothetical protein
MTPDSKNTQLTNTSQDSTVITRMQAARHIPKGPNAAAAGAGLGKSSRVRFPAL